MNWFIKAALPLLCSASFAQTLNGVVDIHAHHDTDSTARSIDSIDLAKLARSRGMRGLVLKSHYEPTAAEAYLVRKEVPGIEIFGGICMDGTVGGVNPAAVEHMAHMKGGWGKVVWMPTFDAENQVRFDKANRPFVRVSKDGKLLPEVNAVLALIAKYKLTLETGHVSSEEGLMILRAAKAAGITRMEVTHAIMPPIAMKADQMKQAAATGAYIEFVYHGLLEKAGVTLDDYVSAMRAVGSEHIIISSDLGQANSPLHPDGLETFFKLLRSKGFTVAEIDRMAKTNPAKVLGLE